MQVLLVANRGEIAVRILRAAAELGLRTVAVYSDDDAGSLHTRRADDARPLGVTGPAAYLDGDAIIAVALETGCDAVHPGYGFLSEHSSFARACAAAGLTFVGPQPATLELLGDKGRARALAQECDVPVLAGTNGPTSLDEAHSFLSSLPDGGAMMIKAIAGGGGRGMRVARPGDNIAALYERCRSEAAGAFGNADLYVEELLTGARHIEVQIVADAHGAVSHLWERECSIQRRHQKVVELAPAPALSAAVRNQVLDAAVRMATAAGYDNIGTFEFLVAAKGDRVAFIEANPRLQVEHTVTEEITGVDIVRCQLLLAAGASLADVGVAQPPSTRGMAMQVRVNMETMAADGTAQPAGGTVTRFEPPSGAGIRVDSFGYAGYTTNPRFDSLLAKVITTVPSTDLADVAAKNYRALCEFNIEGVATNIGFLQNVIQHPAFLAGQLSTTFVDDHLPELIDDDADGAHRRLYFPPSQIASDGDTLVVEDDPLAIRAPLQGTVVSIDVGEGDVVGAGQQLMIMEAMKMEHVITADRSGVVRRVGVRAGDTVFQGHPLVFIDDAVVDVAAADVGEVVDLDAIRADLADVRARHEIGLDAARPNAVERRRRTNQRTARENINDLCDPGTFVEYGPLVIAAQRRRRSVEDLIARTPADGLVAGVGSVNGSLFDDAARAQTFVIAYDYTVLAGTQGVQNHRKKDRVFELAERSRLPMVVFAEGGGGRPGDTDGLGVAGFDDMAFHLFGRLSGLAPLVGIASGRCFAGNAALLGCCDVVIATADANIGMGGPAMIEGGGLGVFRPEDIGPMSVQVPNGVVDLPAADEAEAVAYAKRYLSYFQGPVSEWTCDDQRRLRSAIPENRLRIYDVRTVIDGLADTDSVLELRRHYGLGMVTALIRIEGRAVGVIANNPTHLAGAIDSDGADKASRFMQLCDAFDVPILFLCDTPGIMVGPEAEKTALVRHCSRMFVTGANLSVPTFTVVLRKSYGLGALTMAGGSFRAPFLTVSWPTGEFGGMGLEGAVKLGYRNELAAIEDPDARAARYEEMVAAMYEHGKALNAASHFEVDDVIDPADTRRWLSAGLRAAAIRTPVAKKRPFIDTW